MDSAHEEAPVETERSPVDRMSIEEEFQRDFEASQMKGKKRLAKRKELAPPSFPCGNFTALDYRKRA